MSYFVLAIGIYAALGVLAYGIMAYLGVELTRTTRDWVENMIQYAIMAGFAFAVGAGAR